MLSLRFNLNDKLNVLCLGAHCDDIEIGCGGTLLKLIGEYEVEHIQWVIFTSNQQREIEARKSAEYFLKNVRSKEIAIKNFTDGILPQQTLEIKKYFEQIKTTFNPDLIFTHYRHDLHQDHRLINELTWNTFRNHFILEYEIPKYDGDLGNPGFFVPLNEETVHHKVKALIEYYPSQSKKHWFDKDLFYAFMRIRGMESASRHAEAFYMRKGVL